MTKISRPQGRGPRFNPGPGTRSHMLQLRVHMPQLRLRAAKLIFLRDWEESRKGVMAVPTFCQS